MASKAGRSGRRVLPSPARADVYVDSQAMAPAEAMTAPAVPTGEPIMDSNFTAAADQTQGQAETMFADATEKAKGSFAKGQQMFAEMGDFNKGNVEAIVESSKIAARGLEQVGQSAAAFMRSQLDEVQAQARSLASASSPTEFMKLQGDFARAAFDRLVAQTSKNTEAMMKLAGEIAQPLSNRAALAADRLKTAA
jgi:phasin family protein